MGQWLGLGALTARGLGSILGRGTKIRQAVLHGQKQKQNKQKTMLSLKDNILSCYCKGSHDPP